MDGAAFLIGVVLFFTLACKLDKKRTCTPPVIDSKDEGELTAEELAYIERENDRVETHNLRVIKHNKKIIEMLGKVWVKEPCPYCGCSHVLREKDVYPPELSCGPTLFDIYGDNIRNKLKKRIRYTLTHKDICQTCGKSCSDRLYSKEIDILKEKAISSIAGHSAIWGITEITEQQIDDYIDMVHRARQQEFNDKTSKAGA